MSDLWPIFDQNIEKKKGQIYRKLWFNSAVLDLLFLAVRTPKQKQKTKIVSYSQPIITYLYKKAYFPDQIFHSPTDINFATFIVVTTISYTSKSVSVKVFSVSICNVYTFGE